MTKSFLDPEVVKFLAYHGLSFAEICKACDISEHDFSRVLDTDAAVAKAYRQGQLKAESEALRRAKY